jgi:hypothetical protein
MLCQSVFSKTERRFAEAGTGALRQVSTARAHPRSWFRGSTSKENDSRSLWTKSVKEWSPRWSSCTRTGCVDLDMISCNTSAKGFTQNCWFTVKRKKMNGSHQKRNLAKTCLPSSTSSWQGTMDVALQRIKRRAGESTSSSQEKKQNIAQN